MLHAIFAVLFAAAAWALLGVSSAPILSNIGLRTRQLARILLCAAISLSCQQSGSRAGGNRGKAPRVVVSHTRSAPSDHAETAPLPALVEDGEAAFFIGNSFFGYGRPLPEWVAALGRAVSPPIRIGVGADIVPGNEPLASFLRHEATRDALASRKYKVFILQAEEFEPVDHKSEFHQAVRDFNRAIVASGARTVLFMTWDFPWRPFIWELAASYDQIGRELGIPVIPVGLIYKDCRESPPLSLGLRALDVGQPYWLTADANHPGGALHQNEKGTAVNAYATFAMLTGRNPRGTNFKAAGNTNDDALMRYLSDMSWAEVLPRLNALGLRTE